MAASRCWVRSQRTVLVAARMIAVCVSTRRLENLTPLSSEPSVTLVAAKITSPRAICSMEYFDVNVRELPLIVRRAALAGIITAPGIIRYSEDFPVEGARLLRHVCRLSLEGVVLKRSDAPYRSGRAKDWIKAKCLLRQEFVVAGYVPSSVSTKIIGALVLGYYEAGKLIHAGRVGTGLTHKVAGDLLRLLEPMAISTSPFAGWRL